MSHLAQLLLFIVCSECTSKNPLPLPPLGWSTWTDAASRVCEGVRSQKGNSVDKSGQLKGRALGLRGWSSGVASRSDRHLEFQRFPLLITPFEERRNDLDSKVARNNFKGFGTAIPYCTVLCHFQEHIQVSHKCNLGTIPRPHAEDHRSMPGSSRCTVIRPPNHTIIVGSLHVWRRGESVANSIFRAFAASFHSAVTCRDPL